jgi:hypothetical protein
MPPACPAESHVSSYASSRQGEDAAGLPGGVSRFLLGVDRNESYEPNDPPGEPAAFVKRQS